MIFEVYANPKFLKTLKLNDVSNIYFLRNGFLYPYFLFGFNAIYAFYRGFFGLGAILVITELMLASILQMLPGVYSALLDLSFGLFVGAFAGDVEKWFLNKRGVYKITQVLASSRALAREKFFLQELPSYLEKQIARQEALAAQSMARRGISAKNPRAVSLSQRYNSKPKDSLADDTSEDIIYKYAEDDDF